MFIQEMDSYFLKVVKRYLGGTWQLMAWVCKWEGAGGGTCKVKGNLLIKQSTFAECREGVQKYLGVCSPLHHPSWFMQLEIHKTACSYNFS